MIDNLGICKGSGKTLGHIKVGSDSIHISKFNKHFYSLLNNRAILMARSKKDFFDRGIPVLSLVVKNLSKNAQIDAIKWRPVHKNYTEMVDHMLKAISENLKPVEIFVLKLKPDEMADNTVIDSSDKQDMAIKLNRYRSDVKKFGETINNLQHTSGVLLKTNLDKSIWGSKKVMGVLNDVKINMQSLSKDLETVDGCLEHSDVNADKMAMIVSKNISTDHSKEMIGKIIENFALLKSFLAVLAQTLQRLYNIDIVFKSSIGYPATWFFNGSIFMDFLFEFENLIDHIIKSTSIESKVIEPLLVWKIKLTGV